MCLAIPMRVKKVQGECGIVEAGEIEYSVDFSLVPGVTIEDYVIVHAGFAIERLDKEDAEETIKLFNEIEESYKKLDE